METITLLELGVVVPVTFIAVAAVRRAGLADRFTPLAAIGIGVVLGVIAAFGGILDLTPVAAGFGGALAGGATVGLHQVPKQLQQS